MTGYHYSVFVTLVLAALPSIVRLPLWVAGIAFLGVVLRYSGRLHRGWYGRGASILLLIGCSTAIWFSFESWFSGDSVLSFFIVVVFLKWGESSVRRDYLLLIFSAVILAAVGALYWETLLSLLHMMVVILALTLSLVAIHMEGAIPDGFFIFKRSILLFMLGLPLMLLLFLTFPRIPGPFWDLGLAFGLPVKAMMDRGKGDHGKMKILQPGGISRASQDSGNVLVAEFEGAVPSKSRLYWRGPVFWEYDGEKWSLPEGWDNRTRLLKSAIRSKLKLDRELRFRGNPVHYTMRVMPNGGRWLYGLDVPASPAPEAFISEEFQLLSIRKIDDHEPKFDMLSYLDYNIGAQLTEDQRIRGLSWPENTNPRLRALGEKLGNKYKVTEKILHQAYKILVSGKFQFDAGHLVPPGEDALDRFFFDEKRGGAEYLAGSFVMLMRAAGIPARLISGYRGGTIIALTNFVIVKQADAHAWLEIWQDSKGWYRIDPKDIVLPLKKDSKAGQLKKIEESSTKIQVKLIEIEQPSAPPGKGEKKGGSATSLAQKKDWTFPGLPQLLGSLQKWVINYNPDRQVQLLEKVGVEESNWLDLLVGGVTGVLLLLAVYLGVAWWFGRARVDQVVKTWQSFCRRLEKLGLKKMVQECPRHYLRRVGDEWPELATATEDIIGRYIDIHYGGDTSPEALILFKRQVQRFISMT